MAFNLDAKAAADVVERRWTVPVAKGDVLSSVSTAASGVTVNSTDVEGNDAVLILSAGAAGAVGTITATATTSKGRTIVETLYIPVVVSTASGMTARDAVDFALRKIFGIGETASDDAATDALERLEDMLRLWAKTGANVGAVFPLTLSSVIYCDPAMQSAIKANLQVECHEFYGEAITSIMARNAARGLQYVKSAQLPDEREAAVYY